MTVRSSGVLLHPTCLAGDGIGTLGGAAHRFVDWLASAGQSLWQILPLTVVDRDGSPYNGLSARAGSALLLDLDVLAEEGLLDEADLAPAGLSSERVNYPALREWKDRALATACRKLLSGAVPDLLGEFTAYHAANAAWLDDYVLFRALRRDSGNIPWTRWSPALRDREPRALDAARTRLRGEIDVFIAEQFLFERQWSALRTYANRRGIRIIGDVPIFVAHDSADVWANRDLFALDDRGESIVVSGVPPDYFSETGQRWGNPLYRWAVMRERGYRWWIERFRHLFHWVDVARIDHFRGFAAYWEIPASEETAIHGAWRPGPGIDFFRAIESRLGELPLIAEDLGLITPDVEALRNELGYPGMRVLEFAFDGDAENPHLPRNYPAHCVAYTGTHDNDTAVGWWGKASPDVRDRVLRLTGGKSDEISWRLIELVLGSPADTAIIPLQDVLGLGSDARMNTPGTSTGNWTWRLREGSLTREVAGKLRELTRQSRRLEGRTAVSPLSTGAREP